MKENPITIALETLGQKIIDLTSELENERWFRKSAEERVKVLEAENTELATKLNAVNSYIHEMEEANNERA